MYFKWIFIWTLKPEVMDLEFDNPLLPRRDIGGE